ncbi:MAG: response regulator [Thiomicrorhabdus sp.]|nr:response regulator [Thiomicrorhabdus sp.]
MLKILTLDDSKVIRVLLKMTLESDGIETDSAKTVEEATQLAKQKQYDLMIIDYMLEDGRNGFEFIEIAKKQGKNQQTPSIMLSAEDGQTCKNDVQQLGIKAWIKKPFTPTGLLKVVYQILELDDTNGKPPSKSMHRHN